VSFPSHYRTGASPPHFHIFRSFTSTRRRDAHSRYGRAFHLRRRRRRRARLRAPFVPAVAGRRRGFAGERSSVPSPPVSTSAATRRKTAIHRLCCGRAARVGAYRVSKHPSCAINDDDDDRTSKPPSPNLSPRPLAPTRTIPTPIEPYFSAEVSSTRP